MRLNAEDIAQILSETEIKVLRDQYNIKALAAVFMSTDAYLPSVKPWLDAIGQVFYADLFQGGPPPALAAANRERCLVALLAARNEPSNLAIHIYTAIANECSAAEIGQILALVGAYTGVSNYILGAKVAQRCLHVLKKVAGTGQASPVDVIKALLDEFEA